MKFPVVALLAFAAAIASVAAHHGAMKAGYGHHQGSQGAGHHGQTGHHYPQQGHGHQGGHGQGGHGQPVHYPTTHHGHHDDHHNHHDDHRNYFTSHRAAPQGGHHDNHHDDHHDNHHDDHHDRHHDDHKSHHDDHHDKPHKSEQESHHEDHKEEEHHDKDLWRFQIGEDFGAYEYLDSDGAAKGFYIDLLMAVCRKAGKNCYYMVDSYHNCWNTEGGQELPGVGLMDHYYDGCMGLMPTPDRRNSFNFSLPFAPDYSCALHYKSGTSRNGSDVHGLKIGFVEGWALSKRCFQRQSGFEGNEAGEYTPVLFESHRAMIHAVLRGEVDAILTVDVFDTNNLGLASAGPSFKCTLAGASMMAMYGSEAIGWWNEAFTAMVEDGSYAEQCQTSAATHAERGNINCLH